MDQKNITTLNEIWIATWHLTVVVLKYKNLEKSFPSEALIRTKLY
jgi:hypothetical protein